MNHTPFELARELRRRADDVSIPPGLERRARQRARRISRRRRMAGTLAAVATVAIVVPTALSVRSMTPTSPQPADHQPSPPPASTTPTSARIEQTRVSLRALDPGAPPRISWVEGRTFHRTDGVDVELPPGLEEPVPVPAGAVGRDRDTPTAPVMSSTGVSVAGGGPAVSTDGSLLARSFLDGKDSRLLVAPTMEVPTAENSLVARIPPGKRVSPVGFLGDRDVVSNVAGASGHAIAARRDTFDGSATTPWDVRAVRAVSEAAQLVVGRVPRSDLGSCWQVLPADGGDPLWETCDYALDHFSPDGRLLAGTSYLVGTGDRIVGLLEAQTGRITRVFEPTRHGDVEDVAFEDDSHLLLVVSESGLSAIVRCDFDGFCERATDLAPDAGAQTPYAFGRQP